MNDPIGAGGWRPAALDAVGPGAARTEASPADAAPERWLGELPEVAEIAGVPTAAGATADIDASAARVLSLLGRA